MPRFSAHLGYLFKEFDFLDRFAAARQIGFQAVEFPNPYGYEPSRLADLLGSNHLELVQIASPFGNPSAGEKGLACLPERRDEFRDGVGRAIESAKALNCSRVHVMAGIAPSGVKRDVLHRAYHDNVEFAARTLKEAGLVAMIEPINPRVVPGYFLDDFDMAMEIIDRVGDGELRLLYDIYHAQAMRGDLAETIRRCLSRIAHMQIADNPGRHEPGTGEINFPFLFQWVDDLGYDGWIGCEYAPLADTKEGLDWVRPYLGNHR